MTATGTINASSELYRFAFDKIAKVLGPDRADQLLHRLLGELGIDLQTPQDLYTLSQAMSRLEGYERALGAMLGVSAVLRGATPKPKAH